MRILFIGDIVGRPGKYAVAQLLPRLIREREIHCVIANAENVVGGSGLSPQAFRKLLHQGVDCVTLGDHIYRRREIIPVLTSSEQIVRPANFPREAPGREFAVVGARNAVPVGVISLVGRTYMNVRADCPFHAVDRALATLPEDVRVIVVDVHAEATAEKVAIGWHLDGRVSAVVGTHTHVQTADERVLPRGTAYITDVGMTGPHESVLGRDRFAVIQSLITGVPHPYNVADQDVRLCGVLVDVDPASGRAREIARVVERCKAPPAAAEAAEPNDEP